MNKEGKFPLLKVFTTVGTLAITLCLCMGTVYGKLQLPCSTGEMTRPKPGMTPADLMQVFFHVKYSKDSHDYEAKGGTHLISKNGLTRNRIFKRFRIILDRPKDDIDYKDIVTFTSPENVRGLSVLSWTYRSLGRDRSKTNTTGRFW